MRLKPLLAVAVTAVTLLQRRAVGARRLITSRGSLPVFPSNVFQGSRGLRAGVKRLL